MESLRFVRAWEATSTFKAPILKPPLIRDLNLFVRLFYRLSKEPNSSLESIIRRFTDRLRAGLPNARPLDVVDLTSVIVGVTSPIDVDRDDLVNSAVVELLSADGREFDALDIRAPLEISYLDEGKYTCTI